MAQRKTRGQQINVQDLAAQIELDTTAITSFATGLTTDTGATGLLYDDFDINNVEKTIVSTSIANAFIYDTSLDDDGGEWIKEAIWQSWYHETLWTGIRGGVRAFPSIAIIVLESDKLTIYNGDESDCPLWLRFNIAAGWTSGILHLNAGNWDGAAYMKNGVLYVGDQGSSLGIDRIDFIKDTAWLYTANVAWGGDSGLNIAQRNEVSFYAEGTGVDLPTITNNIIYDIIATSDGNMGNIAYISTAGGVSRIAPDNVSISKWTDNSGGNGFVGNLAISNDRVYWNTGSNTLGGGVHVDVQPVNVPLFDSNYLDTDLYHFGGGNNHIWLSNMVPYSHSDIHMTIGDLTTDAIGTVQGLTKLYPNESDWGRSMIANITNSFNSGILHGDIRGAWLADTDTTSLVGVTGLSNGGFDTDTVWGKNTGWSIAGGVASCSGVQSATSSIEQDITGNGLTINDFYLVKFTILNYVAGNFSVALPSGQVSSLVNADGTYEFVLQYTGGGDYLECRGDVDFIGDLDNVSLQVYDHDRSYHDIKLAVAGTIFRTPAATNAELVMYSNFGTNNFFHQSYNPSFDFGTGDFYVMGWMIAGTDASTEIVLDRGETVGVNGNWQVQHSGGVLNWNWSFVALVAGTIPIPLGEPIFFVWIREGGVGVRGYINGELNATNSLPANTNVDGNDPLRIGVAQNGNSGLQGSAGLIRIGAGVPTVEQIKTIYEQELPMFKENARCTIQGTSSNVYALDHNESDNIITVCTSNAITKFNELIVVDDRTEIANVVSTVNDNEITGA